MMTHPGKKLLFMGQEFAQRLEWNEDVSLSWYLLGDPMHLKMLDYLQELHKLYKYKKALYELDETYEGFAWISSMDADHSIISFERKTRNKGDSLVVVINFTPVVYESFLLAVPYEGNYQELINSDDIRFGGFGHLNPEELVSQRQQVDGKDQAILIALPPLAMVMFGYKETNLS
jgi:1,4-alpha-glucan branching enzyme